MSIVRFVTGPIDTNTYIIYNDEHNCLVIDPSFGCKKVKAFLTKETLRPQGIVITHGHFDHIGGVPEILTDFPSLRTFIHPSESALLKDSSDNESILFGVPFHFKGNLKEISEGEFAIGDFSGKVYVIAGHSPAGCAVHIGNHLFCGDILFANSVGRSDLPGGNHESLIAGIRQKLMALPDETVVCPGHGGRTTIGRERRQNPYL